MTVNNFLSTNNIPQFLCALKKLSPDAVADYAITDVPLRLFTIAIPSKKILIDVIPRHHFTPEAMRRIVSDVIYKQNYATGHGWKVFLCQEKDCARMKLQRIMAHIIELLG